MTNHKQIGWLVDASYVICPLCWPVQPDRQGVVPIFQENVTSYSQPCGFCGRELNLKPHFRVVLFSGKPLLLAEGSKAETPQILKEYMLKDDAKKFPNLQKVSWNESKRAWAVLFHDDPSSIYYVGLGHLSKFLDSEGK